MKTVSLNCAECGIEFEKPKNEYDRRVRKGVEKFYCSLNCSGHNSNRVSPRKGNPEFLVGHSDNRRDVFSSFRWYIRRILLRAEKKNYTSDITVEYLKELWERQNATCPLSGWILNLPHSSETWSENNPFSIRSASLDRIDNNIGYMKGNVRFIAVIANYARNTFSDEEVIEFCNSVTDHNKSGKAL